MTDGPTPPLQPNQGGQDKKPVYKRWWFVAMAVIFGLGVIGSIGGEDAEPNAEAVGTTTTSAPAEVATTEPVTTSTAPPTTTTTALPATTATAAVTTTVAPVPEPDAADLDVSTEELPESLTSELFVIFVRDASSDLPLNWTDAWSDEELKDLGHTICDLWDDGLTFEGIGLGAISVLNDQGWNSDTDHEMLGYVIGAGTEAFCPAHSDKLD